MKRKITFLAICLLVAFASSYSQIANVSDMKWHSETPIPGIDGIATGGVAYYNGAVYVLGGERYYQVDNSYVAKSEVWKYDIITKSWSLAAPLNHAITFVSAAQIGSKVYLYGGFDNNYTTPQYLIQEYDLETETCVDKLVLNSSNFAAGYAAGVYQDRYVMIFGGYDESWNGKTPIQIYDVQTNTINTSQSLSEIYYDMNGTVIGDKVILTKGYTTSYVYYNPILVGTIHTQDNISFTENTAQAMIPSMTAGGWDAYTGNYAFFTCGYDEIGNIHSNTYVYDIDNDSWLLPSVTKPTSIYYNPNFVKVVRNDSVYMASIGGAEYDNSYTNANEWLYVGIDDTPLPVELTSYEAKVNGNTVELTWTTATEVNNYGFEVARKSAEGEYKVIASVEGHGNSSSPNSYSYTDKEAKPAGEYTYKLTQIDFDGKKKAEGEKTVTVNAPEVNELSQNYPNPCNPSTVIKYAIAKAGSVELKVYNTLGEEVATLANEYKEAGSYTATFNAAGLSLPSGIYIYRIKAAGFTETKKLMLIK